jgi:uncharacterized protein (TIGR01777 family)
MIITVTGSSGLIGTRLRQRLIHLGHTVRILSYWGSNNQSGKKDFIWDPENQKIDKEALEGADVVIHLAGSSIAQRWTPKAKSHISRSRSLGSQLLADSLRQVNPKARIVSASGIGYYPDPAEGVLQENHDAGTGFLAQVCRDWEAPFQAILQQGGSAHILRTGLVLSNRGGVLPLVQAMAPLGIVPMTGSAQNAWSWIHLEDVVSLYIAAAEQRLSPGIYNAVAPQPCTQGELAEEILRIQKKTPLNWKPCLPAFVLKALLGEQSCLALTNQNVSAHALQGQGFPFEYPNIRQALLHLHAHHEL